MRSEACGRGCAVLPLGALPLLMHDGLDAPSLLANLAPHWWSGGAAAGDGYTFAGTQ